MNLPNTLERTVVIEAPPETVFHYFTDSARWAAWWGAGSTIDPTPGGTVYMRHSGAEISGEVLEISPNSRIVFTYGYAKGQPIGRGESRVTIELRPCAAGTELRLSHAFAEPAARDLHVQGWRFQLSIFANVVANELHKNPEAVVDAWYRVWTLTDEAERSSTLAAIAQPSIEFRDRYSLLSGFEDLNAHIAAALRFMPGVTLRRKAAVRHCQGTVLCDWAANGPDGTERMAGTSVFRLNAQGKLVSVVSVANG